MLRRIAGAIYDLVAKILPFGKKFFIVGLARIICAIWKLRNCMCFEKKLIRSRTEIECYASSIFLNYCVGLQKSMDKEAPEERGSDNSAKQCGHGSPKAGRWKSSNNKHTLAALL